MCVQHAAGGCDERRPDGDSGRPPVGPRGTGAHALTHDYVQLLLVPGSLSCYRLLT